MAIAKERGTRIERNYVEDNAPLPSGTNSDPFLKYVPTTALVGGQVTTSAPTYSNGDAAALSIDTSGRLRCILDGATHAKKL